MLGAVGVDCEPDGAFKDVFGDVHGGYCSAGLVRGVCVDDPMMVQAAGASRG